MFPKVYSAFPNTFQVNIYTVNLVTSEYDIAFWGRRNKFVTDPESLNVGVRSVTVSKDASLLNDTYLAGFRLERWARLELDTEYFRNKSSRQL